MRQARNDVSLLGTSSAISELVDNGRIDPEKIAEFMQAPTQVTTEKLYPLNAYGSAMAPLFISLSLWIGTLMLCVILKLEVDKEGVPGLTVMQGYIGRWLFFALLVTLQAVVCVAGCLFIGVQAASVPAFFATAILLSLSYLCITYTLSSSFQHIGIGLCIIMVFVQIPGGTGLYPVEMTDAFFRTVYPMFPFTYGINALRETIGGFYGTQWLGYCGVLLLIALSMTLVGLFVRPHLTNLNRLVAKEIKQSDLLNVEEALVPERRYRIGQLIRALSDHDEFHAEVRQRADAFLRHYPRLRRGAFVLGIAVPVVFTLVFAVTTTEKVVTSDGLVDLVGHPYRVFAEPGDGARQHPASGIHRRHERRRATWAFGRSRQEDCQRIGACGYVDGTRFGARRPFRPRGGRVRAAAARGRGCRRFG